MQKPHISVFSGFFAALAASSLAAFGADPSPRSLSGGESDIALCGFEDVAPGQVPSTGWTFPEDDESVVAAYSQDEGYDDEAPKPFTGVGDNYLKVDASGEVTFAAASSNAVTYIDTVVQIPATLANPADETVFDNAKFALWFSADENGTNLCVRGAKFTSSEKTVPATYKFPLAGVTGSWHRVTIDAYASIAPEAASFAIPAFAVRFDGEYLFLGGAPCDGGVTVTVGDVYSMDFGYGVYIPAIGCNGTAGSIASVGFTGSGAVDDIVVTTIDPDADLFTFSWPAGFTPVSYAIDDKDAKPFPENVTSPHTVAISSATSVAFAFRNADGVEKTVTADATEVSEINAATSSFTWADYLGEAVNGAYEIDDLAELKLFQKGISITTNELKLATAGEVFKLTADIALDAPWPGIGVQNGKDIYSTADFNAAAFCGTFDGQNHTISGFQMIGKGDNAEGLDYCGFFNSTYGATIQNLKIAYAGSLFAADTTAGTKESGATFVGVAKNSTLRNLTTVAGTVSCSKGFGGIVGYLTSGTTVDSCTNNVNMTSLAGNKCGGIAMIAQNGSAVTITNCLNTGTQTTGSSNSEYGAIVGYVGLNITIADCETTVGRFLKHQGNTVTLQGVNKGDATVLAYHGAATPGLNFATVNGNVATFVADNALALNGTYKVMSSHAAYAFVSEGAITFDESLATPTVNPGAGRKVTKSGEGPYTYMAEALATPTVTVIGGANATAAWTVNGEPVPSAPATLVEGDTYAVVYTANEGFEFEEGATTSAGGTAGTEDISITISDAVAQGGSALDPENGTLEVTVDAESESAAIAAAKEAIAVPSGSSVGKAVYADYFTYGATGEGGTYTVTITGIKDTVAAGVYESALDRLTDDSAAAIAVPAGLYYSITPSTALPISGTPATGLSTGSVPVAKPGTTAGFYEIKLSPTSFDAP